NQKEVTNGSDFAMKLSFDPSKLTAEQLAAADVAWEGWSADLSSWVGYAIPVGGIDLTNYEIVFDAKFDNMSTTITIYAAQDYEGDLDAVYAVGAESYFKAEDAEDLGNGWYRFTVTVDCENGVGEAADYIVFSLDNTASGLTKNAASTMYVDNLSMTEITYYTVTVDGVEEVVREGSSLVLETPTKDGYEFLGWVDAEGNEVTSPFTPTADVAITSQWEKLPIAVAVNSSVAVDLTALPEEEEYEEYSFTAGAGTYDVKMTGGLRAFKLVDGEMTEEITQFVFTEETQVIFAVTFSATLDAVGSISIIQDVLAGLEVSSISNNIFANGGWDWSATSADADKRAFVEGLAGTPISEGIPEGYNKLYSFEWYQNSTSTWKAGSNPLYRAVFGEADISSFKVVRLSFKLETNGDAVIELGDRSTGYVNEWMTVQLVHTAANEWSMMVFNEAGAIVYSQASIERVTNAAADRDSIRSLVFGAGWIENGTKRSQCITFNPCSSTEMTATLYSTDVVGYGEPIIYDPEISEEAVQIAESVLSKTNSQWMQVKVNTNLDGMLAPTGFSSVTRFDSKSEEATIWNSSVLGAQNFNNIDLSNYSEVWFAVKLANANWTFVGNSASVSTSWVYFHLTQTAALTWTIELVADGEVVLTIENQNGTAIDTNRPINSIGRMFYDDGYSSADGNAILIYHSGSGVASIYTTEVFGVEKPAEPFNPAIPEEAVKVRDSIWRASGYALSGSTDEPAPLGFTVVKEYDWLNNTTIVNGIPWGSGMNDMPMTCFDEAVVDGYNAFYFAMKIEDGGNKGFYVRSGTVYTGGDWLYYYFTRAEDSTWSLTLKSADGKYVAENVQTGLVGSTLQKLLEYNASNGAKGSGCYPTKTADCTSAIVYMTDLRAILKPYDPEIPETATTVMEHIYYSHYFGEGCGAVTSGAQTAPDAVWSEEAAPVGFSKVIEYSWTSAAKDFGVGRLNTADLSGYSDIYFAMKVVGEGTGIYVQGKAAYTGGDWLYVHLSQAADGTWTKSLVSADGLYTEEAAQTGLTENTLPKLMNWVSGTNTGTYPTKPSGAENTAMVYFTEVFGIAKA
ncbi:MAG: hypothetical protein IKD47_01535, partial [Clostridia bacterium]|nr:hypothetical protein [Clostridia bacterium]